jgi:hypothetical protein
MERAGRILGKSRSAARFVTRQDLAQAAWRAAVGKRLAAHAQAAGLYGQRLIVEVEDDVWNTQLSALRGAFLEKMEGIQPGLVTSIEFRTVPRRRMPVAETRPVRAGSQAELPFSERIEDPVLNRIYQASRRRVPA